MTATRRLALRLRSISLRDAQRVVDETLSAAASSSAQRPSHTVSLLSAAVAEQPGLLTSLLPHASGMRGRHRVYNAAARALARERVVTAEREPGESSSPGGRVERVLAVLELMRSDGVRPSDFTLQQLFAAARGERRSADDLVEILVGEMRQGSRPGRASFDVLLESAVEARVPFLVQLLGVCRVRPSARTAGSMLQHARSMDDVAALTPVIDALPAASRRALQSAGAIEAAQARASAPAMAAQLVGQLRLSYHTPLPPPRARRAVLLGCASAGDFANCLALLEILWRRRERVDERTACRLLHVAGEAARAERPGAHALLAALRGAMFGEGGASAVQRGRGTLRRSSRGEEEAIRTLCRAELGTYGRVACVKQRALERLGALGLPPSPKLLSTLVYQHAAHGEFDSALQTLRELAAPRAHGAPPRGRGERPYLAVAAAVRRAEHAEHAVAALRLMVLAGGEPSLRTRVAFARMAARVQQARLSETDAASRVARHLAAHARLPALPGASRFWGPLPQQPLPLRPLIDALRDDISDAEGAATDGAIEGGGTLARQGGNDGGAAGRRAHEANDDVSVVSAASAEANARDGAVHEHTRVAVAAEFVLEVRVAALLERITVLQRASNDGAALAALLSTSNPDSPGASTTRVDQDGDVAGGSPEVGG